MIRITNGEGSDHELLYGRVGLRESLNPVIYCICESMHTDKIFLLGTYPAFPESLGVEYDLLVLIDSGDKKPMHEFESLIANRCHDLAMVTASVHKTNLVNDLLKRGNLFFSALCDVEKLIFNEGQVPLPNEALIRMPVRPEELEKEFHIQYARAGSFLCGANSYRITGDNQLAAFMLHQTAEQALNAFLTPLIGYRLQTHNLNKLFLYARRLSQKFCTIFPRNTDAEIRLYQVLHKAYIFGRYKNNFEIGKEALQILIERLTALLEMTQIIFYEKLQQLRNGNIDIV